MKKILSTLVMCLILGVGSVWSQTYTSTLNVTFKSEYRCTPTSGNELIEAKICEYTEENGEVIENCSTSREGYTFEVSMDKPEDSDALTDKELEYQTKTQTLKGSIHLSSNYLGTDDEYVFSHWEVTDDKDDLVDVTIQASSSVSQCDYTIELQQQVLFNITSEFVCKGFLCLGGSYYSYKVSPKNNVQANITFTAVWVQPQVTGVDNANYPLPTITDINEWREQSVVFDVENDLSKNNFSCSLTGSGFSFKNTSLNAGADTYTAIVAYTPTGIHGSHTGTVTLTSNHPSVDPTSATSTLTVEENYYPAFKMPDTYAVSTLERPTYVGAYTQLMETDIVPVDLNYAARTILPLDAEEKINGAEWKVELPESENPSGFFSLEPLGSTKVIRFTPKGTVDPNVPYTARLDVTCTYYDAEGTPLTTKKSVTLSAYAKNDASARLEIEGVDTYNLNFGDVIYGTPYVEYVSYVAINIATPNEEWSTTSNEITYTNYGSMIAVHLSKDLTMGAHSASLVYKSGDKTATLNVSANVVLGTPELTAHAGLSQITLNWTPVYGANKYIIKRNEVYLIEIADPTIISYVDKNLTNGIEYSYTVTAVYRDDENIKTTSNIARAIPNVPKSFTVDDLPYLGLYTGTNKFIQDDPIYGTFPYSKKRLIDLSKTFDSYGRPHFHELYIFGVTTKIGGEDEINLPSASVECNATTPLYVYKQKGLEYELIDEYDAVKKRFNFILELGETSSNPDDHQRQDNRHLYFTGYCPFAYMGTKSTEEGWMYFKGGTTAVDIYLDNCEIRGRYKTPTGKNNGYEEYVLQLYASMGKLGPDKPNINFIKGASSPFVFTSETNQSGEPYKPTIHIAGTNHLQGQLGSYITRTDGIVTDIPLVGNYTIDAGIGNIYTYNAAITIKPTDLSAYTDLVMTDIWIDNSITNGYLILDSDKGGSPSEKVVAIDLGSPNGSLTINGGQYRLRNSAADGTYSCNLAVGYRMFSKLVEKELPIVNIPVQVLLHLYGFGGDMTESKVIINSGTFTMYKNMYYNGNDSNGDSTFLGEVYYKDREKFLDLRLPAGSGTRLSYINGGTFNGISNVLMCTKVASTGASPKNGRENWLCLQDVTIPVENQQPNGTATFYIPDPFHKGYNSNKEAVCYNMTDGDLVVRGREYGAQSLNFYEKDIDGDSENEKVVSLLLPGDACEDDCDNCEKQDEAIIFQWATAIPKFDATKDIEGEAQSISVGGDISVEVTPDGEDIEYQTNQLLFTDFKGMEDYSMTLEAQGASLGFNEEYRSKPRGKINNTAPYTILKHLNILKTVQADTWYTFTAPFDVHDISVIETNEKAIDVPGRTRSAALQLQAQDNLEILYNLQDFIIPNEQGRASSLTLEALLGTRRQTLVHYDGTNVMSANYYLYELANDVFGTDGIGDELDIVWKPVATPAAGAPILTKGKVYAMQFPWCPMCKDLDSRTYYDYWSNKMILFYGKGPQSIEGTNSHNNFVKNAMLSLPKGHAVLLGNFTLADMTLEANSAYVHNMTNDCFELNTTTPYTLKPMEGFMLYTPNAGVQMPARISRTGQMEYDENVETGVGGVPTVGDRTSLMLYGAYDGFELLSLCEQLVTVYNLQGNIIFQQYMAEGEQLYVATGAGVFIVRGESETIKVMVE